MSSEEGESLRTVKKRKKTKTVMTRQEFMDDAENQTIELDGTQNHNFQISNFTNQIAKQI